MVDVRCYGVSDCEELVEAVTREWWMWRESNPLHQMVDNYLILLDIVRLLK